MTKFWDRVSECEHKNLSPDYDIYISCPTPHCSGTETHCVLWNESERGLVQPSGMLADRDDSRLEIDEVQQWLDECTVEKEGAFSSNRAIQKSYKQFCEDNGFTPKGSRSLGKALSAKGYESTRQTVDGFQSRGIMSMEITKYWLA